MELTTRELNCITTRVLTQGFDVENFINGIRDGECGGDVLNRYSVVEVIRIVSDYYEQLNESHKKEYGVKIYPNVLKRAMNEGVIIKSNCCRKYVIFEEYSLNHGMCGNCMDEGVEESNKRTRENGEI